MRLRVSIVEVEDGGVVGGGGGQCSKVKVAIAVV